MATLIAGLVGANVSWGQPRSGPALGRPPAAVTLPLVANGSGTLAFDDLRGTPVVVEVFASWCRYCDVASATVSEASRAPRARRVRFVGVSLDEHAAQATAVATEWHLPYPIVHDDGRLTKTWHISALPTVVVLDAEGRVRHVADEAPDPARLERWLASVGAPRGD